MKRLVALLIMLPIGFGFSRLINQPPKLPGPVKDALDKYVAEIACTPTGTFPSDTIDNPYTICIDCDKQADAGLLTKEEGTTEIPPAVTLSGAKVKLPRPYVRYDLTDIGRKAYVPEGNNGLYARAPLFCFGKGRVVKVTNVYTPMGPYTIGIHYIAQLDDPSPFLLDPRAGRLGIPLPAAAKPGKPVLYAERDVTLIVNPVNPKDVQIGSMRINPLGQ